MPRPNPERELFAEPFVAARVALERETRGWSYEGLAKRMTDVGCPIQASAIYKIEKATPRRRITVDELVAFAKVFDLSVEELMVDPAQAMSRQIAQLLERFHALRRSYQANQAMAAKQAAEMQAVRQQLADLVCDYPESKRAVQEQLQQLYPNAEPEFRDALMQHIEEGQSHV
jgi:transcriptional regulator with XRE-family HTH domain